MNFRLGGPPGSLRNPLPTGHTYRSVQNMARDHAHEISDIRTRDRRISIPTPIGPIVTQLGNLAAEHSAPRLPDETLGQELEE